ncbi:MAG TPA: permease [Burkholderiaceae bacterium]|nr:permease [Burkholderiaceae bacterium]
MKPPIDPPVTGCCTASSAQQYTGLSAGQATRVLWNWLDKRALAAAMIAVGIALFLPAQLFTSLSFTGQSLLGIAPWLILSVSFAAYAKASSADILIARVSTGSPVRMVALASLFGALAPFCSCGVVPVIAGLLGAGVPLAPVMAFWMSSPLMDPEMFVLTAASLGMQFAVVKTLAAIGIGLLSGMVTNALVLRGMATGGLRTAPSSCCSTQATQARLQWNVFREPARRRIFVESTVSNGWFLLCWMTIAFLLESLMIAYLPAAKVVGLLGQTTSTIPLAILIGIPSYLNGYAALPLAHGLIELGMSPAVALAFLISGGITSIPAATAVWALVKPRIFALYIGMAICGSLVAAYAYHALLTLR